MKLRKMYRKHSKKYGLTIEQLKFMDNSIINGICTNFDNDLGTLLEKINKYDDIRKDKE